MRVDQGREFWWVAIIVTTVASLIVNSVLAHKEELNEQNYNKESIIASTVINTVGDVATVMFPMASPYINAGVDAADTFVDNLIDEDTSHKVTGEIVAETIVSAGIGFLDGLSVRPLGITSEMGLKKG